MTLETRPGLKQALGQRLRLRPRQFDPGPLFAPKKLAQTAKDIEHRLGDVKVREPRKFELDETYRVVSSTWKVKRSLEGLDRRDLKRVPWILFWKDEQQHELLGADPAFVETYATWLRQIRRPSAVAALIRVLLQYYPVELSTFGELLRIVRICVVAGPSGRLRAWRERHNEFQLFLGGPSYFADVWLKSNGEDRQLLERAGFTKGLETCEFLRRATRDLLKRISEKLKSDTINAAQLGALLESMLVDGRLRFQDLLRDTISALLLPFEDRKPAAEFEESIREFTLRHVGDPRIRAYRWQGLERELFVLLRWMVSLTLDQFFEVLSETAEERQWRPRKDFWSYYLDRDLISDAWIVLGPDAEAYLQKSTPHDLRGGYARLVKYGDRTQSVLLMKLGDLVVAEGTHSFACRIWSDKNTHSPPFYEPRYFKARLMIDHDYWISHMGTWQSQIAGVIENETGIQNTQETRVGQWLSPRSRRRYRRS